MKTLQIVGDSAYGGATYIIIEWCKYLLKQGWEVDIICTNQKTIETLLTIRNLNIISHIFIPREISPFKDIRAFIGLMKLIKQNHYDVVHTYTATPGFIGRLAAKLGRVEKIYHHQAGWTIGQDSSWWTNIIYKRLEWFSASISTKSLCVSDSVAKEARINRYIPPEKIAIIKNGIDATPFMEVDSVSKEELRQKLLIPLDSLIIMSISRLSVQKDLTSLIEAIYLFRQKYFNQKICLIVVGEGPERENLESKVHKNKLEDQVLFFGFRADVPVVLKCSDFFVSTTLREGLSISILEAMASAKPIIATDIPENRELIENEISGITIPINSPAKIVEAIEKFCNNPDFAASCGGKAREKLLKEFTLNRMLDEIYQLYTSSPIRPE